MQFFIGIFLFVVVLGAADTRVPWPKSEGTEA